MKLRILNTAQMGVSQNGRSQKETKVYPLVITVTFCELERSTMFLMGRSTISMAIEIVDFPIKHGGSFHGKM